MFLPKLIISLYVLCRLGHSRSFSRKEHGLDLHNSVHFSWTLHKRLDTLIVKMDLALPEIFRWVAIGFHDIPFGQMSWEDIAVISIEEDAGQEISFLKTLHVDANNKLTPLEEGEGLYNWAENGRKKSGHIYYFTLEREVKSLKTCSPVRLVWAYGQDVVAEGYPEFLAEMFQNKDVVLDAPKSRNFECVSSTNNNDDGENGLEPSIGKEEKPHKLGGTTQPMPEDAENEEEEEEETPEESEDYEVKPNGNDGVGQTAVETSETENKENKERLPPAQSTLLTDEYESNVHPADGAYPTEINVPNELSEQPTENDHKQGHTTELNRSSFTSTQVVPITEAHAPGYEKSRESELKIQTSANPPQVVPTSEAKVLKDETLEKEKEVLSVDVPVDHETLGTVREPATAGVSNAETKPSLAADGNWGVWSVYFSCSKSCDGGTKKRTRVCDNPPPSNGGAPCVGPTNAHKSCNTQPCPVDGDGEKKEHKEEKKEKDNTFLKQLLYDGSQLQEFAQSLQEKNDSFINDYHRKLNDVLLVVEQIRRENHLNGDNNSTNGDNTKESKRHCICVPGQHWYDFFKNNENSVYFAVIGISAFFTGGIVLCLACCCARKSINKGKLTRNIRKNKVSFYKVDDFESSADEEVEFLGDDEADDLKNLVKGPMVENETLGSAFGDYNHYAMPEG